MASIFFSKTTLQLEWISFWCCMSHHLKSSFQPVYKKIFLDLEWIETATNARCSDIIFCHWHIFYVTVTLFKNCLHVCHPVASIYCEFECLPSSLHESIHCSFKDINLVLNYNLKENLPKYGITTKYLRSMQFFKRMNTTSSHE